MFTILIALGLISAILFVVNVTTREVRRHRVVAPVGPKNWSCGADCGRRGCCA